MKRILLTTLTTALGFLSLMTSSTPPIQLLGLSVAVGAFVTFIIMITVLPALLTILPFSKRSKARSKVNTHYISEKLSHFVVDKRKPILYILSAVTIIFSLFIFTIVVDNHPFSYFKKGTDFRNSIDFVDKHFKGSTVIELGIHSGGADGIKEPAFMKSVDILQRYLEDKKELKVSHTNSVIDIVKTLNQRLNQNNPAFYKIPDDKKILAENLFLYTQSVPFGRDLTNQVNVDNSSIRVTIRKEGVSTEESMALIADIKQYAKKNLSNYKTDVTGRMAIFTTTVPKIVTTMAQGLFLALVVITFVIAITFRSIKIALISLIPNSTPMLMMFGLIGMTGNEFNLGISMVAAVALGIIVDDTIHFVTKYLKSRQSAQNRIEAVYEVFNKVGSAIISTSVILAIGFGILIFSSFGINEKFGLFTAFTMVIALVMDLTLFPAVLLIGVKQKDIDEVREKNNTSNSL